MGADWLGLGNIEGDQGDLALSTYPTPVADITFVAVPRSTNLFEVCSQGDIIGIVWRADGVWFASPHNMADRSITAVTREEAAARLLQTIVAMRA